MHSRIPRCISINQNAIKHARQGLYEILRCRHQSEENSPWFLSILVSFCGQYLRILMLSLNPKPKEKTVFCRKETCPLRLKGFEWDTEGVEADFNRCYDRLKSKLKIVKEWWPFLVQGLKGLSWVPHRPLWNCPLFSILSTGLALLLSVCVQDAVTCKLIPLSRLRRKPSWHHANFWQSRGEAPAMQSAIKSVTLETELIFQATGMQPGDQIADGTIWEFKGASESGRTPKMSCASLRKFCIFKSLRQGRPMIGHLWN